MNEQQAREKPCCHSCQYWNGEPEDEKPQFCDMKEDYIGPGSWCVRYSRRDE